MTSSSFLSNDVVFGGVKVAFQCLFAFFPSSMSNSVFVPISLSWGSTCFLPNSAPFRKKLLKAAIFGPHPFFLHPKYRPPL